MSELLTQSGVQKFYDKAINTGFARDFQFRVQQLMGMSLEGDNSHLLYLNSASLPGRTVSVVNVPYLGLDFRVPGVAQYSNSSGWRVQFKCDESLQLVNYLTELNAAAYNDKTSMGSNLPNRDLINQVKLVSINGRGKAVRTVILYGAWLTSLGDITYSLTGTGSVVTVDATIAYQYWRIENPYSADLSRPAQPIDMSPALASNPSFIGALSPAGASLSAP